VGGYLAPFYEKLGRPMPPWDFRIPQVKSISADLHKFGYCPKPLSTIVWASEELLQYHYCHPENWPAGPYRMVGFAGSRSAGPVFAAWAIMNYLGEAGYLDLARRLMATEAKLREGVNAIEGLAVFETDLMPFTIRGTTVNLEQLMAVMMEKGWILLGNHERPLINVPIHAATAAGASDTCLAVLADAAERVGSGRGQRSSSLRDGGSGEGSGRASPDINQGRGSG